MRQVLRAGALGRPRGMGWGGRQEGGSGWGTRCKSNHVNPWLIHVNVWQKPLQYCKVISLQLIKINEKKRKKTLNKTIINIKKKKKLSLFFNSFNEIIEFISHGFYVKGNCLFLGLIFMFDMHIQTHNLNSDIKEALLKTFQEP